MVFPKNDPRVRFLIVALIVTIGLGLRCLNLEKTAIFDADQENFTWTAVRLLEDPKLARKKIMLAEEFIRGYQKYLNKNFILKTLS